MVRHREEADVDLPLLAAADTIYRCPHIVIDATIGNAAKYPEPVPVRVKQHLVGLQQISAQQEGPAV